MSTRVLLVGESWTTSATHYKGFDQFGSVHFHTGADPLLKAMAGSGRMGAERRPAAPSRQSPAARPPAFAVGPDGAPTAAAARTPRYWSSFSVSRLCRSRLSNCSRIWKKKTPSTSIATSTSRAIPSSTIIGMP